MAEKIKAILIVEIMGTPAEHVKKSLEEHVKKIDSLKGVVISSIKVSEPQALEQNKNIFTCFGEVEVEADDFPCLINVIFDFMPSSVEILEPENLPFNSQQATAFLSDLSGRLHRYDEIAKLAKIQFFKLRKQVEELEAENKEVKKGGKKKGKKKVKKVEKK